MGIYSRVILPRLVHWACRATPATRQRQKVVPSAFGRVLEIGIGSGLNLPFYDRDRVEAVSGLDPSPEMMRMASVAAGGAPFPVDLVVAMSEDIPLDDESFDTVVTTYTLCTISEPVAALQEMARVLKPGGGLLFCEHGVAPDASVRRWQERLDPVWSRLGGGCHLNRDVPALLRAGGFRATRLEAMYLPGWRPASFNFWGSAEAAVDGT